MWWQPITHDMSNESEDVNGGVLGLDDHLFINSVPPSLFWVLWETFCCGVDGVQYKANEDGAGILACIRRHLVTPSHPG